MASKSKPRRRAKSLPGEIVGEINGLPVRRIQVGAVTGAKYNPRTISDRAFQGLAASTAEFGLVQAPVWNKTTQRLVGGHQRLKTQDPDDFVDVVEVELDLDREKALNLALNSPHIAGEFTVGLADIIAGLEVEIPDLASELRFDELYVDVPVDMDDMLGGDGDPGDDVDVSGDGEPRDTSPPEKPENYASSDLRQIVLVLTGDENDEAIRILDSVMKNENCASYTEAVMHLLRDYDG